MRTLAVLCLLAAVLLPGCAAAVPAVSAISAGAAAGEKGYSFWQSGHLYYVDEGSLEDMDTAVRRTLERLDLDIHDERDDLEDGRLEEREWAIRAGGKHLVRLSIKPMTRVMTGVDIDAGFFGNRAAAELVANRIKLELDAIHATQAPGVITADPLPGSPE